MNDQCIYMTSLILNHAININYPLFTSFIDGKTSALETVGMQLMVVQLVSVLEIINPMLGLVKSGVKAPIMQVHSIIFFCSPGDSVNGLCGTVEKPCI